MWTILQKILELVSPEIRDALIKFVLDLEAKAKLTPNLWDDVLVFVLKKVLAIS